jgi:hypothetical protein
MRVCCSSFHLFSSLHARVLCFLLAVSFLMHAFFPQKCLAFPLWTLSYLQQPPNTNMWLIPIHLSSVCFLDLLGDHLELFPELCCLCLCLRSLLLECVHYLDCNFITDQFYALYLGLCYMCLGFLCLCQHFCYPFLQQFHLSLPLLFLRLHDN